MTKTPRTWEDVERMPDDGNRYEWIGGRLYMTPAPVTRHQRISKRLQSALMRILEHPGHGETFQAPCLVGFPGTDDRVQPDLLFISNRRRGSTHEAASANTGSWIRTGTWWMCGASGKPRGTSASRGRCLSGLGPGGWA